MFVTNLGEGRSRLSFDFVGVTRALQLKIPRDVDEAALNLVESFVDTSTFERSTDENKKVEMGFAHLETHHSFERIRLRRLSRARDLGRHRSSDGSWLSSENAYRGQVPQPNTVATERFLITTLGFGENRTNACWVGMSNFGYQRS